MKCLFPGSFDPFTLGHKSIVDRTLQFAEEVVIAIGVKYGAEDNVVIGPIHFSGLALSALVGIVLNAILPGKLGMKVKSVHGKEKK